nr:MAG TPA: hypothetical protein [Caudoviricetes sp.]
MQRLIFYIYEESSIPRFSQKHHYCLMLQRCQCPLPGYEVQFLQFCGKFGIQYYPSVQL